MPPEMLVADLAAIAVMILVTESLLGHVHPRLPRLSRVAVRRRHRAPQAHPAPDPLVEAVLAAWDIAEIQRGAEQEMVRIAADASLRRRP
jgi:hypothetical protein